MVAVGDDIQVCEDRGLCEELGVIDSPRSEACACIKNAIDKLAEIAESDEKARESIANLSVVLLDLK